MADHAAPSQSPKVLVPLAVGVVLTGLAAAGAAVTPETLKDLGVWALPASMGITAAAGYIAGYLKRDPLRETGQQAIEAGVVPPVK